MKNKISRLDHVNFTVNNLEETVSWYNKVFNYSVVENGTNKDGSKWGILKSGDSMLAVYEEPARKINSKCDCHKFYHFGIQIQDEKEWEEIIKANSVKVTAKVDYPHSRSWYIEDPTGHEIEVSLWNNDTIQF